nr:unnamed protein product [Callosobruchus analis]
MLKTWCFVWCIATAYATPIDDKLDFGSDNVHQTSSIIGRKSSRTYADSPYPTRYTNTITRPENEKNLNEASKACSSTGCNITKSDTTKEYIEGVDGNVVVKIETKVAVNRNDTPIDVPDIPVVIGYAGADDATSNTGYNNVQPKFKPSTYPPTSTSYRPIVPNYAAAYPGSYVPMSRRYNYNKQSTYHKDQNNYGYVTYQPMNPSTARYPTSYGYVNYQPVSNVPVSRSPHDGYGYVNYQPATSGAGSHQYGYVTYMPMNVRVMSIDTLMRAPHMKPDYTRDYPYSGDAVYSRGSSSGQFQGSKSMWVPALPIPSRVPKSYRSGVTSTTANAEKKNKVAGIDDKLDFGDS